MDKILKKLEKIFKELAKIGQNFVRVGGGPKSIPASGTSVIYVMLI